MGLFTVRFVGLHRWNQINPKPTLVYERVSTSACWRWTLERQQSRSSRLEQRPTRFYVLAHGKRGRPRIADRYHLQNLAVFPGGILAAAFNLFPRYAG